MINALFRRGAERGDSSPDEKLGYNWLTPKHLDLTYKGRRTLDFQAVKCAGIDISLRSLSNKTDT
jgi:hypothetical protein